MNGTTPPDYPSVREAGYEILSLVGSGVSAKVYRAVRVSDKRHVAIKIIPKIKVPLNKQVYEGSVIVPLEVYILKRLSHPNIITLLDNWQDATNFYIVMEAHGQQWHKNGSSDLFECVEAKGPLPEHACLSILQQLVSVCKYLQNMQVWHLDLKDENLSCDSSYRIKLLDFGSAMISEESIGFDQLLTRFYGTLKYCPPEVFKGQNFSPQKADQWSLGVILFTCLNGHAPFKSPQDTLAGQLNITRKGLGQYSVALVKGLLQVDPEKRFSLEEVQQRLTAYKMSGTLM